MFNIFLTTVNAVLPIVLLIALGYALKRIGFFNDGFLKVGNKLVFKVCLPCMLFVNIYDNMSGFADIRWDVVVYSLVIIAAIFFAGLITAILTTKDNRRRGVLLQCVFRSNFAIIGLTLVERLGGNAAVAGIVSAFSIPVFNALGVVALTVFMAREQPEEGDGRGKIFLSRVKTVLKGIITNPLIIAVLCGLAAVGIREAERAICGYVPFSLSQNLKFLYICLSDLKAVASPFALLVLGGQFRFSAVKGMSREIIVGCVWRVALTPLIGIGLAVILTNAQVLNFGPDVYPTLIALFGTPVAVSSAIMAGAMGNDEQLATQYVVYTSLLSVFSVFLMVFLLMSAGLVVV